MSFKRRELPTQKVLQELLSYDRMTGKLFWKDRAGNLWWTKRFGGKEAFTAKNKAGYKVGSVHSNNYVAHRVVYKMVTGEEPPVLDHINGIRDDNRVENLRASSYLQNAKNRFKSPRNTSGKTGVTFYKDGVWRSQIRVGQRRIHLGLFNSIYEASLAYEAAKIKHGFSGRHGSKPNIEGMGK